MMSETQVQTDEQAGVDEAAQAAASEASGQADEKHQENGEANGSEQKTIATGADAEKEEQKNIEQPYWPEDWAEKAAKHYAGDDEKAYKRELKRLERIKDPVAIYGMYRDLDNRLNGGGLVKMPGDKATDEEKAEFAKSLGWTDRPEELIDSIKLENDAVLGDADKPVLENFLKSVNGATNAKEFAEKAANWYFSNQEEQAAALDQSDEDFRRESEKTLKEAYGPAFDRKRNGISTIFATAPGGTDVRKSGSLIGRLMGGRMDDGKIIGNDPDFVNWIVGLVDEVNPTATILEDGAQGGVDIDGELDKLRDYRKNDKAKYYKDEKAQARYRELLSAKDKMAARK